MDNRLEVSVAEFITVRFQLCASKFEGGAPRVSVAEFITVRFQRFRIRILSNSNRVSVAEFITVRFQRRGRGLSLRRLLCFSS